MKRAGSLLRYVVIITILAISILIPTAGADANIKNVRHYPQNPYSFDELTIYVEVENTTDILEIRILYCQTEPDFLCYAPTLNMTLGENNTYEATITRDLSGITKLGYNITLKYENGTKENSPVGAHYHYVSINTSLDGDGGEPCPKESTLALQVLILILIVIIVFLILKHLRRKDKSKPMGKKTFGVILVIIIILLSILAIYFTDQGDVSQAPDFTLTDIDGNTFNLSDYQGQVVILDMMSIPCTGCKEVEKDLKEIYPEYKDDVVFISIDILREDSNEMLRDYRDRKNLEWTIARDTDDILLKYNVDGIPKVIIIDKDGYATYEHRGETDVNTLKERLDLAIEGKAEAVSIQQASFISLAIFAGIASFFSPCSFPMLPGYIAYYLKKDLEAGGKIALRKAAVSGTVSAAGIILVYISVGIVVIFAGASIIQNIGYFMIVVGILLILLGALMFTPLQYWKVVRPFQTLWAKLRGLAKKRGPEASDSTTGEALESKGEPGFYSGLLLYGLGYGAAASGCTAPLFIAVMSIGIVSGFFIGILILVLYTATAALLMIAVTVTIAYFGAGAAQKLSKYTEVIKKISGAVLVAVGIFLIWTFMSTL